MAAKHGTDWFQILILESSFFGNVRIKIRALPSNKIQVFLQLILAPRG